MALVKFCVFVTVNINVIRNNRQVCVCARVFNISVLLSSLDS